jgi:hypothetical protein
MDACGLERMRATAAGEAPDRCCWMRAAHGSYDAGGAAGAAGPAELQERGSGAGQVGHELRRYGRTPARAPVGDFR